MSKDPYEFHIKCVCPALEENEEWAHMCHKGFVFSEWEITCLMFFFLVILLFKGASAPADVERLALPDTPRLITQGKCTAFLLY